jgi:hypothetical protein
LHLKFCIKCNIEIRFPFSFVMFWWKLYIRLHRIWSGNSGKITYLIVSKFCWEQNLKWFVFFFPPPKSVFMFLSTFFWIGNERCMTNQPLSPKDSTHKKSTKLLLFFLLDYSLYLVKFQRLIFFSHKITLLRR